MLKQYTYIIEIMNYKIKQKDIINKIRHTNNYMIAIK